MWYRFRTPYVRSVGYGAQLLATAMHDKLATALTIDGRRAFECPKTSAAFHEAGHCVVGAIQGDNPSKASIWPIVELGRSQWIGRTYGFPRWRVDNSTHVEADLKQARSQSAGVVSEMLFDSDYRLASSVDEIVTAQSIVQTAALKLRCDPEHLWLETLVWVATRLKANEPVVREVADQLMCRGSIKTQRLVCLLRSVGDIDGSA